MSVGSVVVIVMMLVTVIVTTVIVTTVIATTAIVALRSLYGCRAKGLGVALLML